MNLVVGDEDCEFLEVCNILKTSKTYGKLLEKLFEVGNQLNVPADDLQKIKMDLFMGKSTYPESLREIVVSWRSKFADRARMSVLLEALEKSDLTEMAEMLRSRFTTNSPSSKKFTSLPEGVEEFVKKEEPGLLVVCCQDVAIAENKLLDNTFAIRADNRIQFASRLASDTLAQLYTLACGESTFSQILGVISKPVRCKGVIFTTEDRDTVNKHCSEWGQIKVVKDALKWSNLSSSFQEEVLERNVKVSGRSLSLREVLKEAGQPLEEVLDEKILADLINDKEPNILEDTIPPPIKYYIERQITSRKLLKSSKIFKTRTTNIFLFSGIERAQLSKYVGGKSTDTSTNQKILRRPSVNYMLLDMKSDFVDISKKANVPVHWIDHSDDKFYWVKSSGDMNNIHEAIDEKAHQKPSSELEFLETLENERTTDLPVVLSDSPGMGKSLLLSSFARQLVTKGEVVLFGVISEIVKAFKAKVSKGEEMEAALLDLIAGLAGKGLLVRSFMKQSLKSSENIINVMMDGLDEVLYEDKELAQNLLKCIRKYSSVRLWVATRPHLLEHVENYLNVLGYNILPFNPENQRECLIKYWNHDSTFSQDRLKAFAKACHDTLHKSMKDKDHEIAGVPIQCMLIAELFAEEARNYSLPENLISQLILPFINITSISDLYKRLVEKKLDKYFERYKNATNKVSHRFYRKEMKRIHIFYSLQLLFPNSKIVKQPAKLRAEDVLNVGLLEFNGFDGAPRFIHRTIAEYFVAAFTAQLLRNCERDKGDDIQFLAHICASVSQGKTLGNGPSEFRHHAIVFFLNNLIPPPTHHPFKLNTDLILLANACVYNDFPNLFNYFHQSLLNWNLVYDEELILLIVQHSSLDLIKTVFGAYEDVSEHKVRHVNRNDGDSILDVAVQCREYSVVEYIINFHGFRELIENYDMSILKTFGYCLHSNHDQAAIHLEQRRQILRLFCVLNPNLLEKGIQLGRYVSVNPSLVGEFILAGANLDSIGHHNNTSALHMNVLNLASAKEYHKLVTLIPPRKLSNLLHLKDEYGSSPLKLLISRIDPDQRTLQLFSELGADFNAVDNYEESVLSHAVANRRSLSTLEQLIFHGARETSDTGWSILHSALQYENVHIFKHFAKRNMNNVAYQEQLDNVADYTDLEDLNLTNFRVDLNARHSQGFTLMDWAVSEIFNHTIPNLPIFSLLASQGFIFSEDASRSYFIKLMNDEMKWLKVHDSSKDRIFQNWPLLLKSRDLYGDTLLHNAAEYRRPLAVKYLIDKGADVNAKNSEGHTPAHKTIATGERHEYNHFGETGLDFGTDDDSLSLKHLICNDAAENPQIDKRLQIMRILAEGGTDMAALDKQNKTPLDHAITNKDSDAINYLVYISGNQITTDLLQNLYRGIHHHNCRTITKSVLTLSDETTKLSELESPGGFTLLHSAVLLNDYLLFECLVEDRGFREMLTHPKLHNIVHHIVEGTNHLNDVRERTRMLELVVKLNAGLTNALGEDGRSPLLCKQIHLDLLICLLENGADPTAVDSYGQNVAYLAANYLRGSNDYNQLVEYLVGKGHGNQLACRSKDATTTLLAAKQANACLSRRTLELSKLNGVNLNVDKNGETLLTYCARRSDVAALAWLLEQGADLTATNSDGSGVVHLAAEYGNVEAVRLLISKGCEVNTRNKNGETPLHCALKGFRLTSDALHVMVETLLENGADLNAEDSYGNTPSVFASFAEMKSSLNKWTLYLVKGMIK